MKLLFIVSPDIKRSSPHIIPLIQTAETFTGPLSAQTLNKTSPIWFTYNPSKSCAYTFQNWLWNAILGYGNMGNWRDMVNNGANISYPHHIAMSSLINSWTSKMISIFMNQNEWRILKFPQCFGHVDLLPMELVKSLHCRRSHSGLIWYQIYTSYCIAVHLSGIIVFSFQAQHDTGLISSIWCGPAFCKTPSLFYGFQFWPVPFHFPNALVIVVIFVACRELCAHQALRHKTQNHSGKCFPCLRLAKAVAAMPNKHVTVLMEGKVAIFWAQTLPRNGFSSFLALKNWKEKLKMLLENVSCDGGWIEKFPGCNA